MRAFDEPSEVLSRPDQVFRAVAEHAIDAVFVLDQEGRTTFANRAAEEMFGWSQAELAGRKLHDQIHYKHADGSPFPMSECPLGAVFQTGQSLRLHDDVFYHRDGRPVPVTCSNGAIHQGGEVIGGLLIVRDVTERRRVEEHNELLRRELNHRVKNNLTLVQAIARRSLKNEVPQEVLQAFEARLQALGSANQLLIEGAWATTDINGVVDRILEPFRTSVDRIQISGPQLTLQPAAAVALALSLHELATNAIKHGALSSEAGSVQVRWSLKQAGTFKLTWSEHGGPAVHEPDRRGFGLELMRRVWASTLNGAARLSFLHNGLSATFSAPLNSIELTVP